VTRKRLFVLTLALLVLTLALSALALSVSAQTVYALRVHNTSFGSGQAPPSEIVLLERGAELDKVLMTLPSHAWLAAFDAGRERMYFTVQGDDMLSVADLRMRTITRTQIASNGRSFIFDAGRSILYAAEGLTVSAIDTDSGAATLLLALDRPVVLAGVDGMRQRLFVTDPDGGDVRMIDITARTLSAPLVTVRKTKPPPVVVAELDQDVIDVLDPRSSPSSSILRLNLTTGATTTLPVFRGNYATTLGYPTPYALDPRTKRLYTSNWSDWDLSWLATTDLRTGQMSGGPYCLGDSCQVVVVPSAASPSKPRASRR
jgi:hypothetical protein